MTDFREMETRFRSDLHMGICIFTEKLGPFRKKKEYCMSNLKPTGIIKSLRTQSSSPRIVDIIHFIFVLAILTYIQYLGETLTKTSFAPRIRSKSYPVENKT